MKIVVNRRGCKTTADLSNAQYPYQYREAIKNMLELDGLDSNTIDEIIGIMPDKECIKEDDDNNRT
jgi:hypothetical protein